jgi:hypothetical protein
MRCTKKFHFMTTKNFQPPTDEEIARYAYYLWESEGRIGGRDLDYWLQAKAHLTTTREYEAGILTNAALKNSAKRSETPSASSNVPAAAKSLRKRQSRSMPEPAFA